MEQTAAIQTNDIYGSFLVRKRQLQPATAKKNMPAQKPDSFTKSGQKPEKKSFFQKYWGGLLAATAGVIGGSILAVSGVKQIRKVLRDKQIEKLLQEINAEKTILQNNVDRKRDEIIAQSGFKFDVNKEWTVDTEAAHVDAVRRLTKKQKEYSNEIRAKVDIISNDPEIKDLREFRRNIDEELRKLGRNSITDKDNTINMLNLSKIRQLVYDAIGVKSGRIDENHFNTHYSYNCNELRTNIVKKLVPLAKEAKDKDASEILKLFPDTELSSIPMDRSIIGSKTDIDALFKGSPLIKTEMPSPFTNPKLGSFVDVNMDEYQNIIKQKKDLIEKMNNLNQMKQDYNSFVVKVLEPQLQASDEMKALKTADEIHRQKIAQFIISGAKKGKRKK